jgi:tetratricopeptide (TPR) repeat protein
VFPGLWKLVSLRCKRLSDVGRDDRAIRLAERLTRWRPHDPNCWIVLLAVHRRAETPSSEQVAFLREAVAANPGSDELAYYLSRTLVDQERIDEATRVLTDLRTHDPDSPLSYLGLAFALVPDGDRDEQLRLAMEAADRVRSDTRPLHLRDIAMFLLFVPEERSRAIGFLHDAARANDARAELMLSVVLAASDPTVAAAHRTRAMRRWSAPASFDDEYEAFGTVWKQELDRTGEAPVPPNS